MKRFSLFSLSVWVTAVLTLFLSRGSVYAAVQNPLLSGDMPAFGDVQGFLVSPNGAYAVFKADSRTDTVFELFSTPTDGSLPPVPLNNLLPNGAAIGAFGITNSHVVYLADQDTLGQTELYSIPIAGGSITKLNLPLGTNAKVHSFEIAPDNATVVYRANQTEFGPAELYRVGAAGGTAVKITPDLADGGNIQPNFSISTDSQTVYYLARQDAIPTIELYKIPLAGGASTTLSAPLVAGGNVSSFVVSPTNNAVIYTADQEVDERFELYSNVEGTITKLNGLLTPNGDVAFASFSPNGNTVIYLADQQTDTVNELYSVPVTGGTLTKLNHNLAADENVLAWNYSPDSNWVIYNINKNFSNPKDAYSVPITGGTPNKLTKPSSSYIQFLPTITPDSQTAVYIAQQDSSATELYRVPLAGGPITTLNAPLAAGNGVVQHTISFDGQSVIYLATQENDNQRELYSIPLAGGTPTKLSGPLVANGNVSAFRLFSSTNRIFYMADQRTDEVTELFATYQEYKLFLPLIIR